MAGNPQNRRRFTTDVALLQMASIVPLLPDMDRTVLYAEDVGARRAAAFVAANPGHTRVDDLLNRTDEGRGLLKSLEGLPWSDKEEVWWELSWRLARAAKGTVQVFGPDRFMRNQPLSSFKHKYTTGAYANSVLEKVELPELECNQAVTQIFFNGKQFD